MGPFLACFAVFFVPFTPFRTKGFKLSGVSHLEGTRVSIDRFFYGIAFWCMSACVCGICVARCGTGAVPALPVSCGGTCTTSWHPPSDPGPCWPTGP